MPICKATITITLLAEETPEKLEALLHNCDLKEIAEEIDNGDWIGQTKLESVKEVPQYRVRDELLELGNDGNFFNDSDGIYATPKGAPSSGLEAPEHFMCSDLEVLSEALSRVGLERPPCYEVSDEAKNWVAKNNPDSWLSATYCVRETLFRKTQRTPAESVSVWRTPKGFLVLSPDLRRQPQLADLLGKGLRWLRVHYSIVWLERLRKLIQTWPGQDLQVSHILQVEQDCLKCQLTSGHREQMELTIPIRNEPTELQVNSDEETVWDPLSAYFQDVFFDRVEGGK